jgi:AGZA family xanthine/uracil permease-like MFS transporter
MEKFFKLKQNGTTVGTEVLAGATTFFTMVYIIFVNPAILSATGMPKDAVFLATIFAAFVGTVFMGLFANVPYALAPGMGLNAFFAYTVCSAFGLKFSWQEGLALVFICGVINIIITFTKVRKEIIKSIPAGLQNAISGGIGVFIAYIGIKEAKFLDFTSDWFNILFSNYKGDPAADAAAGSVVVTNGNIIPALVNFSDKFAMVALIGLILIIVLMVLRVKGAILIGIIAATLIGSIPFFGIVDFGKAAISLDTIGASFTSLGTTFGAAFGPEGFGKLFGDISKLPIVILTIFAFSLSDTFDTVGTFIGTGRKTGIFDAEDEKALTNSSGFKSKMDKALFADSIATSVGAVFGTSNTTTYIESAAGIEAGGKTGLTSVVTALLFLACIILAPIAGLVPAAATSPALIVVGILMMGAFAKINWEDFEEAVPAFFAAILMAFCYNISYGIAFAFIFYCLIKLIKGKGKEVHPIIYGASALFLLNFIIMAVQKL